MTKFTDRAKKCLVLASQAAHNQDSVREEHLLLGLLRERYGVGGTVLLSHGLTVELLKEFIEKIPGNYSVDRDQLIRIPLSAGFQQMLSLAEVESSSLGHQDVGTEHLLLALADPNHESVVTKIFEAFNINKQSIRDSILQILGGKISIQNVDFQGIKNACLKVIEHLEKYSSQSKENAAEVLSLLEDIL